MASGGAIAAEMARRDGGSVAEPTAPEPTPHEHIEHWIMRAFADLATCRPIGMGIGPIPWTAIDAWCERHGIRGDAREVFESCVRALDRADLAEIAAEMKQKGATDGR